MQKNLSIVNQNNKLMLKKSKSLMVITNSILTDDWMKIIWDWSDENNIPDCESDVTDCKGLPRDKNQLVHASVLNLGDNNLIELPKEIGNLSKLTMINLEYNMLTKLPKEIGNLTGITKIDLSSNELVNLPREIGNLSKLTMINLECNMLTELPKEIGNLIGLDELDLGSNKLSKLPKEIGNLKDLTNLLLDGNRLTALPNEICNLKKLSYLRLYDNPLSLTVEQTKWIDELLNNNCDVRINDENENLSASFEIERRYKYLDEFNAGREVPITPEMLDNDISPRIIEKLAEGEVTFEEFLDEVSDYLDKEKFNDLVQKIYDRDYDLGTCFERNITFETFQDDKLTWSSIAEGEDKNMLITHWGLINMFVKDTFGFETKIVNIPASKN